jgi:hypothetical protein
MPLAGDRLPRPSYCRDHRHAQAWRAVFFERDYQRVRELGREHHQKYPRRIAS